jgi:transcription-repair coupling factor (superfamily II helicase)
MYLRILDEAVAELSEDREEKAPEVYLELEYSGYIPDSYISEPVEKMEVYKKITSVTTQEELDQVHFELQDRFGPLPEAVQSLLSLAEIRIICGNLSISALRERSGTVEVEFSKVSLISADKVVRLIQESAGNVKLAPSRPNVLLLKSERVGLAAKSEYLRERLSMLV